MIPYKNRISNHWRCHCTSRRNESCCCVVDEKNFSRGKRKQKKKTRHTSLECINSSSSGSGRPVVLVGGGGGESKTLCIISRRAAASHPRPTPHPFFGGCAAAQPSLPPPPTTDYTVSKIRLLLLLLLSFIFYLNSTYIFVSFVFLSSHSSWLFFFLGICSFVFDHVARAIILCWMPLLWVSLFYFVLPKSRIDLTIYRLWPLKVQTDRQVVFFFYKLFSLSLSLDPKLINAQPLAGTTCSWKRPKEETLEELD